MTNINPKILAALTTIAIFALPIAEASARALGHYS